MLWGMAEPMPPSAEPRPPLLIVDDDPEMCTLLTRLLREQCGPIRAALTTEDAEAALDASVPDLAIVDWSLRTRDGAAIDAASLLERLAAIDEEQRPGILVLTGRSDRSLADRALALGADDFAIKPIDNSNLRARVGVLWRRVRERRVTARRERRYQLAIRAARDAIWDWDVAADDLYLSRRFFEMLRCPEQNATYHIDTWLSRIHEADRSRTEAELNAFISGLMPVFDTEVRMRTGDGQVKWLLCRAHAIRGAEGTAQRIVGAFTDLTDRGMADALTGLPGRQSFHRRLMAALDNRRRRETAFAVAFFDLDRFKWINDSHGHDTGDEFLRIIARRLEEIIIGHGSVFRIGGDEFVTLLENVDDESARTFLEDMRRAVARPAEISGELLSSTVSIGYIHSHFAGETEAEIMRAADAAMYLAKRRGGNQIAAYDAIVQHRERHRRALAADLQQGFSSDQFVTHFQPIVPSGDAGQIGFEALVRWQHPERGLIYPGTFIAVAEETGQINRLAGLVFDHLLDALNQIHRDLPGIAERLFFSVNVSSTLFTDGRVADLLEARLPRSGIEPSQLIIELTESVLITDTDGAVNTLRRVRDLGCRIALDDFGTGYSSLSHLFSLPIDHIKIDQNFVQQLPRNSNADAIVRAVTELGHALNLTVVAEGVERQEQLDVLLAHGIDYLQGYLFSQPLPLERMTALLQALDAGQAVQDALHDVAADFIEQPPREATSVPRQWYGPVVTQDRLEQTAERLSSFIDSLTGQAVRTGELSYGPLPVFGNTITARIPLHGDYDGLLLLSTPRPLLDSVSSVVYPHLPPSAELLEDIAGEFANIIAGTATQSLGLSTLQIGIPEILAEGERIVVAAQQHLQFVHLPLYWNDHVFWLSLGFSVPAVP